MTHYKVSFDNYNYGTEQSTQHFIIVEASRYEIDDGPYTALHFKTDEETLATFRNWSSVQKVAAPVPEAVDYDANQPTESDTV